MQKYFVRYLRYRPYEKNVYEWHEFDGVDALVEFMMTADKSFDVGSNIFVSVGDLCREEILTAYELEKGTIGSNLWHRGECGSFITKETYDDFLSREKDEDDDYGNVPVSSDPNHVSVIYGDEYEDVFSELSTVMSEAASRMNISHGSDSYN